MAAEQATKTRDEHYNAVSVLYHVLQEGDTADQYIKDARQAGDEELAEFFTQVQSEDRERAQRAKELLKARL
ncbi:MAG: hypothetical protein M0026_02385 [Nocardiopsaceae bacterium]|nr:hypothetical protein [Nocardiopsaceae bacterium]